MIYDLSIQFFKLAASAETSYYSLSGRLHSFNILRVQQICRYMLATTNYYIIYPFWKLAGYLCKIYNYISVDISVQG